MPPILDLISTDFDGTLYSERDDPPVPRVLEETIARLQAAGSKWVINTGRDFPSLMEGLDRARLNIRPDFLVVVEREIRVLDGDRFIGLDSWNEACHRDHGELFRQIEPDVAGLMTWVRDRFAARVYEDAYSPFCLVAATNQDADAIVGFLGDYARDVESLTVVRNDVYARFSHEAYNKGTALDEIARQIGAPPSRVFAAGDHFNDLPMLSRDRAGWLLAPANAVETVKDRVREQGGLVSPEDCGLGVAWGLSRVLESAVGVAGRLK